LDFFNKVFFSLSAKFEGKRGRNCSIKRKTFFVNVPSNKNLQSSLAWESQVVKIVDSNKDALAGPNLTHHFKAVKEISFSYPSPYREKMYS
jgi:hypothetical protein